MEIYRAEPFPFVYSRIPWIRACRSIRFVDCHEDLSIIEDLKLYASRRKCISELDGGWTITIKIIVPDDILELRGETNKSQEWTIYNWKIKDIANFVDEKKPPEAISLSEADIDNKWLVEVSTPRYSCLDLLHKAISTHNYKHITKDNLEKIKYIENAVLNLEEINRLIKNRSAKTRQRSLTQPIPQKIRLEILRRDGYKCILCGSNGSDTAIEVDHIIPKSIIAKLDLPSELILSKYNLAASCRECNNAKRDTLTINDISKYLELFNPPNHPNNRITHYLLGISKIQNLRVHIEDITQNENTDQHGK